MSIPRPVPAGAAAGGDATTAHGTRARAVRLVLVLWTFDLLLIACDLLRHRGVLHDVRFAVTTERGFGEWFQYLKAATVAVLLFMARRETAAATAWSGLFLYLLLDDAFEVHEHAGRVAASVLGLPAIGSIRPEQLGELIVYGSVGLAFTATLAVVLRRRDAAAWRLTLALVPPFAVLVFFGAFVDLVHSFMREHSYRYAAGLIEDGGEMLAMSGLVAVAWWVTWPATETSSCDDISQHPPNSLQ